MHKKYVRFKRDLNRRKGAAQNSAERRVDREGEGQGKDTERAFAYIKETFSRKTKRLLFCGGGKAIAGRLGCAEEGGVVQKKGKSSGLFEHPCGRKKRRQRALNAALPLLDGTKNSAPPPPKLLHSFVAKAQKRQREYFCFCAWFFSTAVGYR